MDSKSAIFRKVFKPGIRYFFGFGIMLILLFYFWPILQKDWFGVFLTIPRNMEVHDPEPIIPPKTNRPDLFVMPGVQGGIYKVYAFVNPGREGALLLKIFEATGNVRLSEEKVREDSFQNAKWSSNMEELFQYQALVHISEGDWGTYFPARFELWFEPKNGQQEKIIEKIYRIEGWQR